MGFGCNSFAPCNGRFPLLIFLCAVFFDAGSAGGALLLTSVIAGSVLLTLAASRLLSAFFLRGLPSSFVLELPPYRAPQPGRVIVRSVLDRTVFVLGRAMIVAAPAGALIWLLANITVSGSSLYGSTALCTLLFTICHWPCSTTCLTVFRETRSVRYTLAAIALPTCFGLVLCALVRLLCVPL